MNHTETAAFSTNELETRVIQKVLRKLFYFFFSFVNE